MTDNEQDDEPMGFKLLDEDTMFTGHYYWLDENNVMQTAKGVWSMEDVNSVSNFPDSVLPEMPAPRCCLLVHGGHLYLHAPFSQVQQAWRNHRRAQSVRQVFPFSGIFPFSGN